MQRPEAGSLEAVVVVSSAIEVISDICANFDNQSLGQKPVVEPLFNAVRDLSSYLPSTHSNEPGLKERLSDPTNGIDQDMIKQAADLAASGRKCLEAWHQKKCLDKYRRPDTNKTDSGTKL